ncbi:MAG: hypothetical protein H6563_11200 [Lewinellaceae bacterium]|nr:hypothetical protein [Lewinellaceae bacterium]
MKKITLSISGITTPAVKNSGIATLYRGQDCSLKVDLQNTTGGDIDLQNGSTTFSFRFPKAMEDSIAGMKAQLQDWVFNPVPKKHLMMTYSGSNSKWPADKTLSFTINKINSKGDAGQDYVRVSPSGFNYEGDRQLVILTDPPVESNAKLSDVLNVPTLDQNGAIFISKPNDPLKNTLFLNIKNKMEDPIFKGDNRTDAPKILVSFSFGETADDLCQMAPKGSNQPNSPWNINPSVEVSEGNDWHATMVTMDSGDTQYPQWKLEPQSGNKGLIKGLSNVTFGFDNIVSMLPKGHTQMILHFIGFQQSDTKKYDPWVQVLDINKTDPPPRGVVYLTSDEPVVTIPNWNDNVKVKLKWAIFQSHKVELLNNTKTLPPLYFSYSDDSSLVHGGAEIDLKGFTQRGDISFTLYAKDGNGGNVGKPGQFEITLNYPDVDASFELEEPSGSTNNPKIKVNISPIALVDGVYLGLNGGSPLPLPVNQKGNQFIFENDYHTLSNGRNLISLKNTLELSVKQKYGNDPVVIQQIFYAPYINKNNNPYKVIVDGDKIWLAENFRFENSQIKMPLQIMWGDSLRSYINSQMEEGWRLPTQQEWDDMARLNSLPSYTSLAEWEKSDTPFLPDSGEQSLSKRLLIQAKGGYGYQGTQNIPFIPSPVQAVGANQFAGFWTATEDKKDSNRAIAYLFANNALDGQLVAFNRRSCPKNYCFFIRLVRAV